MFTESWSTFFIRNSVGYHTGKVIWSGLTCLGSPAADLRTETTTNIICGKSNGLNVCVCWNCGCNVDEGNAEKLWNCWLNQNISSLSIFLLVSQCDWVKQRMLNDVCAAIVCSTTSSNCTNAYVDWVNGTASGAGSWGQDPSVVQDCTAAEVNSSQGLKCSHMRDLAQVYISTTNNSSWELRIFNNCSGKSHKAG